MLKEYIAVSIFKPSSIYVNLFHDKRKVLISFSMLMVLGILYTITVIFGYKNGFGAIVKPILSIPSNKYYFYEIFFGIPVFFLISIVFAGTSRLLSTLLGGEGSFENNFVIYCTSAFIPTLLTLWLPETLLIVFFPDLRATPLDGFKILPAYIDFIRQILGVLWPMFISVIGIRVSENVTYLKSSIITFISFILCGIIMIIFIR